MSGPSCAGKFTATGSYPSKSLLSIMLLGYFVFTTYSFSVAIFLALLITHPVLSHESKAARKTKKRTLCLYLSISLTRLCLRSFRSNILTSRISITLCTSLSMRSLSSKELAKDCSALCTLRSSSTLRISSSCIL